MRRRLRDGYELDDDPGRVDAEAVHRFLANDSYWATGRSRETVDELIRTAERVVGLYAGQELAGFCRAVSDGHTVAWLADVFVLPEHRGRGLGVELVAEMVDRGPLADCLWLLGTADAHELYERFGFAQPSGRIMARSRRPPGPEPSLPAGVLPHDVLDPIVDAFNRRDLEAFVAGYAADVVIEGARGEPIVRGAAELRARYGAMFAEHQQLSLEVVSRTEVGDFVVDVERIAGRGRGVEPLVVVYHLGRGVVDHERIIG